MPDQFHFRLTQMPNQAGFRDISRKSAENADFWNELQQVYPSAGILNCKIKKQNILDDDKYVSENRRKNLYRMRQTQIYNLVLINDDLWFDYGIASR